MMTFACQGEKRIKEEGGQRRAAYEGRGAKADRSASHHQKKEVPEKGRRVPQGGKVQKRSGGGPRILGSRGLGIGKEEEGGPLGTAAERKAIAAWDADTFRGGGRELRQKDCRGEPNGLWSEIRRGNDKCGSRDSGGREKKGSCWGKGNREYDQQREGEK